MTLRLIRACGAHPCSAPAEDVQSLGAEAEAAGEIDGAQVHRPLPGVFFIYSVRPDLFGPAGGFQVEETQAKDLSPSESECHGVNHVIRGCFSNPPKKSRKTGFLPGLIHRLPPTADLTNPSVHTRLGWSGHGDFLKSNHQDMEPKK